MNDTVECENSDPLLTICVPTYNRSAKVYLLATYLLRNVVVSHGGKIELLIVNNCSTDDTTERLSSLVKEGVRVVNREEHLPSAEANMFGAIALCRGRFIWFHGDDDIPILKTIEIVLGMLAADQADLFVANSVSIDTQGIILADRVLKINAACFDVDMSRAVWACGFTYVLAGISAVIFRRSMVDTVVSQEITNVQEIYAHVAWLIRCFTKGRIRILSAPLVYYRTDEPEKTLKHFKIYAERNSIGDYEVWSFGLIRLLRYLWEQRCLTLEDLSRIYDGRRDGTRFRLIDEVIFQMYRQIRAGLDGGSRNKVLRQDLEKTKEFLCSVDLFAQDTLFILDKLAGETDELKRNNLCQEFEILFERRSESSFYRPLLVECLQTYRIYQTPVMFVALSKAAWDRRAEILAWLDPLEEGPDVLVDTSLVGVRGKIDNTERRRRAGLFAGTGAVRVNGESGVSGIVDSVNRVGMELRHLSEEMRRNGTLNAQGLEMGRQSTYLWRALSYYLVGARLGKVWRKIRSRILR